MDFFIGSSLYVYMLYFYLFIQWKKTTNNSFAPTAIPHTVLLLLLLYLYRKRSCDVGLDSKGRIDKLRARENELMKLMNLSGIRNRQFDTAWHESGTCLFRFALNSLLK